VNNATSVKCHSCAKLNFNKFSYHTVQIHYPTAKQQRHSYESETFSMLGRQWKVLMFAGGNQQARTLSAYLKLVRADSESRYHNPETLRRLMII
jgi:hypothetical protein